MGMPAPDEVAAVPEVAKKMVQGVREEVAEKMAVEAAPEEAEAWVAPPVRVETLPGPRNERVTRGALT